MGARQGAIPIIIYIIGRTHVKEMKDLAALEAFFSLTFLLLSLGNLRLPLHL